MMTDASLDLDKYFAEYQSLLKPAWLVEHLTFACEAIRATKNANGRVILAGNGGSAGTVSHLAVDLTKQAKTPAINFHDPALITAFANDFGYEHVLSKAFEFYASDTDIVVCLSVSGSSPNLLRLANAAKSAGNKVIAFTGKRPDNSLGSLAEINFWVDSQSYNIVECIHSIWATTIVDMLIGKSVYEV